MSFRRYRTAPVATVDILMAAGRCRGGRGRRRRYAPQPVQTHRGRLGGGAPVQRRQAGADQRGGPVARRVVAFGQQQFAVGGEPGDRRAHAQRIGGFAAGGIGEDQVEAAFARSRGERVGIERDAAQAEPVGETAGDEGGARGRWIGVEVLHARAGRVQRRQRAFDPFAVAHAQFQQAHDAAGAVVQCLLEGRAQQPAVIGGTARVRAQHGERGSGVGIGV